MLVVRRAAHAPHGVLPANRGRDCRAMPRQAPSSASTQTLNPKPSCQPATGSSINALVPVPAQVSGAARENAGAPCGHAGM